MTQAEPHVLVLVRPRWLLWVEALCAIALTVGVLWTQTRIRTTQTTNGVKVSQTLQIAKDTKHIVKFIDDATSPAGQKLQQAKIAEILSQFDCATQHDLDVRFIASGLLKPGTVPTCSPATPTTTEHP